MKIVKISFISLLAGLTGLWLLSDELPTWPYDFFELRSAFLYYSGVVGIGVMSVAMVLAARPVWVEPALGGLDKMYRLHKWLGITGLTFAIVHWLWSQAPKWLVASGWLERPVHTAPPDQTVAAFRYFQAHHHLAENLGEWAFYAAAILMVLALVKRFPYHYFFKTHIILAAIYLILVFHAVVLMKFSYWSEPIGPVMAVVMALGSAAALVSLFGRVGLDRRAVGVVEGIEHHPDIRVIKIAIRLTSRWDGHEAGQFAFVRFGGGEGPHPFTISSAWSGDGRMFFLVKDLGDYTSTLAATLKIGDVVKIEGPYGQFNFKGDKPRQIWIGGGIGITPFISRMRTLADQPDGKIIDLFHTTALVDDDALGKLWHDARGAHVNLHVLVDAKDGRLSVERICQAVPDWKSADVWFCGPSGFRRALRRGFTDIGLSADDFHHEIFELR